MRRLTPFSLVALALTACAADPERQQFVADELADRQQALQSACPPVSSPEQGPIQGIDISVYQTVNDWNAVAASEKFVIIKATQGATSVDSKFASHRAGAKGAGMVVGYYHYLTFTSSGSAQADNFLKAIGTLEPTELPPMLDVEDSKNAPSHSTAENVQTVADWLNKVEQALGRKPMIYSGNGFWGGPNFGNPPQFASYSFCWARYSASNSCPQVPDNLVPQIKFWQYRADAFPNIPAGQTNGISGAVDQDVFYGDLAAFNAFIGSGAAGPDYQAKYSKQSYPLAAQGAVEVKVGEKVQGFIEVSNAGTATWKPGSVFLAPIPRDQASPYHADTWASDTRVSTVDSEVKPGEIGHFNLDISGQTPGEGSLKLGWVAEGITWFADPPKGGGPPDGYTEVKIKVLPADPGSGGSAGQGGSAGDGGSAGSTAGQAGTSSAGASGAAGAAGSAGSGGSAGGAGGAGGAGSGGQGGSAGKGAAGAAGAKAGAGGVVSPNNEQEPNIQVENTSSDDSGCGCRAAPAPAGGLPGALLGAALLLRRLGRRKPHPPTPSPASCRGGA